MKKRVRYSTNNSGGDWWLSDDDWKNLEKAGWIIEWRDIRCLGALATEAYREGLSLEEAINEFEETTGQSELDQGCECCGSPHYFYEEIIKEEKKKE